MLVKADRSVVDAIVGPQSVIEPRRVTVIVNPATRHTARRLYETIVAACPPNRELKILESPRPGAGAELARSVIDWADLVVAAGGDGTVADVATGLLGTSLPLSILPAGSTNIIAQELGIDRDVGRAAKALFGRLRVVRRDAGRCGSRLFLHMAGAGMDARIFQTADRALKRRAGWIAYLPAAVAALRDPPASFTITTDTGTMLCSSPLVLVANGGSIIHPAIRFGPTIRADDGWLDLIVFPASPSQALAGTVARMATVRVKGFPDLEITRARRIEIAAAPPVLVQLDGDVFGLTPTTIEVVPGAMNLAIPAQAS